MTTKLLCPALILPALQLLAQTDDVRAPLLQAFPTALRWDNLESLPAWCGAVDFSRVQGVHALWLEPGRAIHVPMPPGTWLRIRSLSGDAGHLEVGVTDGAGLISRLPNRGVGEAIFGPGSDQPSLFRLYCPEGAPRMQVALFVSRQEEAGALPLYLHEARFPGPSLSLTSPLRPGTEHWQALAPDQGHQLSVRGPARLWIQSRLHLSQGEPFPQEAWALTWQWENGKPERVPFRSRSERLQPFFLDGRPAHLGQLESIYLDVPSGTHTLTLRTDRLAIARATRHSPNDVLMTGLNGPHPRLTDLPPVSSSESSRLSSLREKAQDPRYADSALAAWAKLSRWADSDPENRELQRQRQRLGDEVTLFRDLLPREEAQGSSLRAIVLMPELTSHPGAPRHRVGFPGDVQNALSGLPQATFLRLDQSLSFDLPPRQVPTELRLLVDRTTLPSKAQLCLTFDEGVPLLADLATPPVIPAPWKAPGSAEWALALATGSGTSMPLLPCVEASVAQWSLPAGVKRVRVTLAKGSQASLRMALQVRAGRAPEPPAQWPGLTSETEVRAWLQQAGTGAGPALPWLPLQRWLETESRAFRGGVVLDPALVAAIKGRPSTAGAARPQRVVGTESIEDLIHGFRSAPNRPQAMERMIQGLDRLGEVTLSEQWLKGVLSFSDEVALRDKAASLLEARLQESGRLASCLADRALNSPTPSILRSLGMALIAEGKPRLALLAATLIPPTAAPELWVRAGRLTQREDVVRQGLAAWGSQPEARLWEGILHLDQGRREDALASWERAGEAGVRWRQALTQQQMAPGPKIWRTAPEVITSSASSLNLHALQLDTHQQAFMAKPGEPVRLRVAGPVRMRIEARPLYTKGKTANPDGWLHLREGAWHRPVPFQDNRPAGALAIWGREDLTPGQSVVREWELGPGNHELSADFGSEDGCIAVSLLQPEVMFPSARSSERPSLRWTRPGASRSGVFVANGHHYLWAESSELKRVLLASRRTEPPLTATSTTLQSGPSLETLLRQPLSREAEAMALRLDTLAWFAEEQPARRRDLLAQAEQIAQQCPEALLRSDALERLRRNAVWAPVGTTGTGAGLRAIPRKPFETDSVPLRIRRALLDDPGDLLLGGQDAVLLTLQQLSAWTLSLRISAVDPAFAPPAPLTLVAELDQRPTRWTLEPGAGIRNVSLAVPAGRHNLRLRLESPFRGQWARISFPAGLGSGSVENAERRLEVATASAPVFLRVDGPRWLQVEQFTEDRILTTQRFVPPGPQTLRFVPEDGRPQSLLAFHLQDLRPDREVLPVRPLQQDLRTLPSDPEKVPEPRLTKVILQDAYPLGKQEDGTWSYRLRGWNRLDLERETGILKTELQRVGELRVEHRFTQARTGFHRAFDFAVRQLEDSGQSTAFSYLLESARPDRRSCWYLDLNLWGQMGPRSSSAPEESRPTVVSFHGTAGWRAPMALSTRLSHEPGLAISTRSFRFTEPELTTKNRVNWTDQDIWSPFKRARPNLVTLSESLHLRPWQDTTASLEATASGWRFEGDGGALARATAYVSLRQRLGAVQLLLGYGASHIPKEVLETQEAITQSYADFGLEGRIWTKRQGSISLGTAVRYHTDKKQWTGGFTFGWRFGHGRGLLDARRGSQPFLDLEKKVLSRSLNNTLQETLR